MDKPFESNGLTEDCITIFVRFIFTSSKNEKLKLLWSFQGNRLIVFKSVSNVLGFTLNINESFKIVISFYNDEIK